MSDRTIHGAGEDSHGDKYHVVRYNRGGKWWIEFLGGYRRQIDLDEAVKSADHAYLGKPGGRTFDSRWAKRGQR